VVLKFLKVLNYRIKNTGLENTGSLVVTVRYRHSTTVNNCHRHSTLLLMLYYYSPSPILPTPEAVLNLNYMYSPTCHKLTCLRSVLRIFVVFISHNSIRASLEKTINDRIIWSTNLKQT